MLAPGDRSYDTSLPLALFGCHPNGCTHQGAPCCPHQAPWGSVTILIIRNGLVLRRGGSVDTLVPFPSSSGLPLPVLCQRGLREDKTTPSPGIFPCLPFPRLKCYPGGRGVRPPASGSRSTCSGGLPLVIGLISPPPQLGSSHTTGGLQQTGSEENFFRPQRHRT